MFKTIILTAIISLNLGVTPQSIQAQEIQQAPTQSIQQQSNIETIQLHQIVGYERNQGNSIVYYGLYEDNQGYQYYLEDLKELGLNETIVFDANSNEILEIK